MTKSEKEDDKNKKIKMLSTLLTSIRSNHPEIDFMFLLRDITNGGKVHTDTHIKNVTSSSAFYEEAKNLNATLIGQIHLKFLLTQHLSNFVVCCTSEIDQHKDHTPLRKGMLYTVSGIRIVGKEIYYDIVELPNKHLDFSTYMGYKSSNFIRFTQTGDN